MRCASAATSRACPAPACRRASSTRARRWRRRSAARSARAPTVRRRSTSTIRTPSFSDRLNQLDIRFSKIFHIGNGTFDANFDIYNSFNSDAQLALTTGYSGVNGGTWLRPTSVIQGRIIKFGFRWDF